MQGRTFAVALATAASLLAVPASASAAKVTGKLDVPGLTVVAVAPDGTTRTATANAKGKFTIANAPSRMTLHLRKKDGSYAGPIVIKKRNAKLGVMGVKSATALGAIDVKSGWALVEDAPKGSRMATSLTARLKKGVPVGALKLGLVKLTGVKKTLSKPGQDADRDGIINAFDVDDDGDLKLDNVDSSSLTASSSGEAGVSALTAEEKKVTIFSNLKLSLESSLNANAGATAMSRAAVNYAMTSAQTLAIKVVPGDEVELDCGGLSYCSTGGTGIGMVASGTGGSAFPSDYDSDGDGYGTIEEGPTGDFQLMTGAEFTDIGAGDMFLERVTVGSSELLAPGMLNYAFTSTPAVTSWSDDSSASTNTVSYPTDATTAGSTGNPASVQAEASGDVVLTFTLWRPQRPRIAPFEAKWVDIGKLGYSVDIPNPPSGGGTAPGTCDAASYSESDSSLSASGDQLMDSAVDRDADAANTLTFTVNVTDCLGSGATWDIGETLQLDLQARTLDGDNAAQKLHFERTA